MNNKKSIWTSANIVTMIRILFVPIFVVVLISPWPRWIDVSGNLDFLKPWIALVVFVVLSLTDSVDGYLARSRNEITNFGKFMDPLADKILVFAALIALVELNILPSWVVLIILMREFIISGIRMLAASQGKVIAASWYGKAKTAFQLLAIILFILKESLSASGAQDIASPLYIAAWAVMIIALILTIVSMIDYIRNAMFVFKDEPELSDLADQVIKTSIDKGVKIGVAESLTGGLVSAALTGISGSSSCFNGGIVSYIYEIKNSLLGVPIEHLNSKGAINEKTAKTMASGALTKLNSDIAVSTTGIAGPKSDEFNNPLGTVYVGFATKDTCEVEKYQFEGNREEIRKQTVIAALSKLIEII